MIINEFEIILKDGRKAVIKSPSEEDIKGLIDCFWITARETHFLSREPEDIEIITFEKDKEMIENCNKFNSSVILICVVDNKVVGKMNIMWKNNSRIRHRASIGIAIIKEFWGLGIGTAFF